MNSRMRGKKDFTAIYSADLPDDYFSTLSPYDYRAPDCAVPYIQRMNEWLQANRPDDELTIVDVGSSYGFLAMILRTRRSFSELAAGLIDRRPDGGLFEEYIEMDREHFACHPPPYSRMIGIDISESALSYGTSVGLLDRKIVVDLDREDIAPLISSGPAVLICTGTLGYIGPEGLRRLISAIHAPILLGVLILSRTLRVESYLGSCVAAPHLSAAALPHALRQRRFVDAYEREAAIGLVSEARPGIEILERDGWVYGSPLLFASAGGVNWLTREVS